MAGGASIAAAEFARGLARDAGTAALSYLAGAAPDATLFLAAGVALLTLDRRVGLVYLAGGLSTVAVAGSSAWRVARIARRSPRAGDRLERTASVMTYAMLVSSASAALALAVHDGRSGRLSTGSVVAIVAYLAVTRATTVALGRELVRAARGLSSAERLAALVQATDG